MILGSDDIAAIVAAVWDEVLTSATHNVAKSAGKRLRQLGSPTSGTVSASPTPSATVFGTDLSPATSGWYDDTTILFSSGALNGLTRVVYSYDSGVVTLDEALPQAPAPGDTFDLTASHTHPITQIADAVMGRPVPASYAAGTAGYVLGNVGTAEVVVAGPTLVDGGTLSLVRGDDYAAGDNRAISFTSSDWPVLTGATVVMTMRRRVEAFGTGTDQVWFAEEDTVASRVTGVGSQTVVFELTSQDTAALVPGTQPGVPAGKWDIQATLTNGDVFTLATGVATVVEDQTR